MPISNFTVSAPATSGNLGPGFDVLGMALDIRNVVKVKNGSGVIRISGHGSASSEVTAPLATDATNLIARAMEHASPGSFEQVSLDCTNRIPLERGLGSSAAAAACGLIAGWHVGDVEWDENDLVEAITKLDGHPDNAAACAYGGITIAHDRPPIGDEDGYLDILPMGDATWIKPIIVVPDRTVATSAARAVLPTNYTSQEVAQQLGAMGLLMVGLAGAHTELIQDALAADVMHERQRADLVPELAEVREAVESTDALGATLSGAGPTILVWTELDTVDQILGSLQIDFPEHDIHSIDISGFGARIDR